MMYSTKSSSFYLESAVSITAATLMLKITVLRLSLPYLSRHAGCSQTLTSSPSEVGLFLLKPLLLFYPALTKDSELLQLTPH